MCILKRLLLVFFVSLASCAVKATSQNVLRQEEKSDTLVLAQSYMNLWLTHQFYDSIPQDRTRKILTYENQQLAKLKSSQDQLLYTFSRALLKANVYRLLDSIGSNVSLDELLERKKLIGSGLLPFNEAYSSRFYPAEKESYYEMINFRADHVYWLIPEYIGFKNELNEAFDEYLYSTYKSIYQKALAGSEYDLQEIQNLADQFSMDYENHILLNTRDFQVSTVLQGMTGQAISRMYTISLEASLLARFLQFKFLLETYVKPPTTFDAEILFESFDVFREDVAHCQDEFIKEEFTSEVLNKIHKELKRKFSKNANDSGKIGAGAISPPTPPPPPPPPPPAAGWETAAPQWYYFPVPAPKASADFTKADYLPQSTTLALTNKVMSEVLTKAGYTNHKHYYYAADGFALATSLERINSDGSVSRKKRFSETFYDQKFSYYEMFKSMFFDLEADYRLFVFIVASEEIGQINRGLQAGAAEALMRLSYDHLPSVLESKKLANKKLTALVYHFHQNDIAQVPELNLSGNLSLEEHIEKAGLTALIK